MTQQKTGIMAIKGTYPRCHKGAQNQPPLSLAAMKSNLFITDPVSIGGTQPLVKLLLNVLQQGTECDLVEADIHMHMISPSWSQ